MNTAINANRRLGRFGALALALAALGACGSHAEEGDAAGSTASSLERCGDLTPHANAFGMQIGSFEHRNADTRFDGNLVNINTSMLHEMGVRWVRLELRRDASDGAGMDFLSYYEDAIHRLHEAGIRVLVVADYLSVYGKPDATADANEYAIRCKSPDGSLGPRVASPGPCAVDQWEVDVVRWQRSAAWESYVNVFVSEMGGIAERLGPIADAWEIWNEPDTSHPWRFDLRDWDTHVPPQYFADMLVRSRLAIKMRFPHTTIISGGVASGHREYVDQVLTADPAAFAGYDGVGVHIYNGYWVPDKSTYMWMTHQRYAVDTGLGLPIWLTEAGSTDSFDGKPFNDGNSTREFIETMYRTVAARPDRWGPAFYFSFSDRVGKSNEAYGLLRNPEDGGDPRKPQFHVYKDLAHAEPYPMCAL